MVFYSCKSIKLEEKRGFTLIELLVVISVLAILGAFGFAALVNYDRQQTLKTAARDLRTNLRLAQSKAIVQEKPTACTVNELLSMYRVRLVSNMTYKIIARCSSGTAWVELDIKTLTLPINITITQPATFPSDLDFLVSTGALSGSTTTIILSGFGSTEPIIVNQNGVIQ